jgi:hypothetical protein
MAGEMTSARAQATPRNDILRRILVANPSFDFGHLASATVRFIVNLFRLRRLKRFLYRIHG